jgi:hypothetical protein
LIGKKPKEDEIVQKKKPKKLSQRKKLKIKRMMTKFER